MSCYATGPRDDGARHPEKSDGVLRLGRETLCSKMRGGVCWSVTRQLPSGAGKLAYRAGVAAVAARGGISGKVGVFEHGVHAALRALDGASCQGSVQDGLVGRLPSTHALRAYGAG